MSVCLSFVELSDDGELLVERGDFTAEVLRRQVPLAVVALLQASQEGFVLDWTQVVSTERRLLGLGVGIVPSPGRHRRRPSPRWLLVDSLQVNIAGGARPKGRGVLLYQFLVLYDLLHVGWERHRSEVLYLFFYVGLLIRAPLRGKNFWQLLSIVVIAAYVVHYLLVIVNFSHLGNNALASLVRRGSWVRLRFRLGGSVHLHQGLLFSLLL